MNDIVFMKDDFEKYTIEKIKHSSPTDIINLSGEADKFIQELWEPEDNKNLLIPADIIWAKTIPLLDCEIYVTDDIMTTSCRVVIFDDYEEIVDNVQEAAIVGAIVCYTPFENEVFIPICIAKGGDYIGNNGIGTFFESTKTILKNSSIKNEDINQWAIACLETWYGIQISLLHPEIQTIFKNPSILPYERKVSNNKKNSKKRKVKYIKKHVLTIKDLESIKSSRNFNRKCLAWYVIGHWRTLKTGNQIFIKPYWKGALRNLKSSANDGAREREISM